MMQSLSARRAWIETCPGRIWSTAFAWSLSARRAWIETDFSGTAWVQEFVALRKESVDRNVILAKQLDRTPPSLSARRAWIETIDYIIDYVNDAMSLSARRAWIETWLGIA